MPRQAVPTQAHDSPPTRQQRVSSARPALLVILLAVIATLLWPAAPASAAACRYQYLAPSPTTYIKVGAATRCLINEERTRHGRKALLASGQLRKAAQRHSLQMVRQGFFDHTGAGGSTLHSRVKHGTSYLANARQYALAENIAMSPRGHATARQLVHQWMRSPGHRQNLLHPGFRHLGIGVAAGDAAASYTAVFGARS
ncbi:MAG: CAP domain-containing protein [Solirubrobacteraceae bacterium]|nr:CAP domain-containing protein [Solirubrobacteraceae bacterium]